MGLDFFSVFEGFARVVIFVVIMVVLDEHGFFVVAGDVAKYGLVMMFVVYCLEIPVKTLVQGFKDVRV